MKRINKTQFSILGALTIKPMSAYDIKKFMRSTTAHFWAENDGQIYPTLKKLLNEKYVKSKDELTIKDQIKKVYSITKKGERHLIDWIKASTSRPVYRNDHLLKLLFGNMVDSSQNVAMIQKLSDDLNNELAIYQEIKSNLSTKTISKNRMDYTLLTLEYGVDIVKAEIKWCNKVINTLTSELNQ